MWHNPVPLFFPSHPHRSILEIDHLDLFRHKLYAHIDEGSLKGSRANVTGLFENTSGRDEEILPKPDYKKLEEISKNVKFN